MPTLEDTRTWNQSCEVAVTVYRALAELPDRSFATRVITNAFSIPETVAAGCIAASKARRRRSLENSAEALAILQTQIYLAAECGLLPAECSARLLFEAREVTEKIAALREAAR